MPDPAPPFLPTQRLGWSVFKSPRFKTRKQESISGRLLRVVDQPYPIYEWTLTWEILRDQASLQELRTILGFYEARLGAAGVFLYQDPTDKSVTGQYLGTGNGTTTTFSLVRQLLPGSGVALVECASTATIYLDGVVQSVGYAPLFSYTGFAYAVQFTTPPGSGVVVSADLVYAWPCHFSDDTEEFENFAYQMFALKKLKFESLLFVATQ